MNIRPMIYLISGPLGVGKSSVSKELAKQLKDSLVIEGDIFFLALEGRTDISWDERCQLSWERIVAEVRNNVAQKQNIVVDFVVGDELEWFIQMIRNLNVHLKYVVLITDESTLAQRLEQRGSLQYLERSLKILRKVTQDPSNQKHLYDTTGKCVKTIAQDIIG